MTRHVRVIAALFAATMAGGCDIGTQGILSRDLDARCQLAFNYINLRAAKDIIFLADMDMPAEFAMGAWWFGMPGWDGDAPPTYLMRAAKGEPLVNALNGCPGLTKALNLRSISTALSFEATGYDGRKDSYPKEAVWITLPIISGDGEHAVLYDSSQVGFDKASGDMYYLRKDSNGKWRQSAMAFGWIT